MTSFFFVSLSSCNCDCTDISVKNILKFKSVGLSVLTLKLQGKEKNPQSKYKLKGQLGKRKWREERGKLRYVNLDILVILYNLYK